MIIAFFSENPESDFARLDSGFVITVDFSTDFSTDISEMIGFFSESGVQILGVFSDSEILNEAGRILLRELLLLLFAVARFSDEFELEKKFAVGK